MVAPTRMGIVLLGPCVLLALQLVMQAYPALMLQDCSWQELAAFPSEPCLVIDSPLQRWYSIHGARWHVDAIISSAEGNDGDYLVTLQSADEVRFCHHVNTTADGSVVRTQSLHTRDIVTLREALGHLFDAEASHRKKFHYLSAAMDDLPIGLAEPLIEALLSGGCVCDARYPGLVDAGEVDCPNSPCRGVSSRMWFGAASVSTAAHYDVSHNVFLQAYGNKTFFLLPPRAHRTLRLHPAWHGSRRQSQLHMPDLATSGWGRGSLSWRWGSIALLVAELRQGQMLYVPPVWFHHVRSDTRSIGVNAWMASMHDGAWERLLGKQGERDAWISAQCAGHMAGAKKPAAEHEAEHAAEKPGIAQLSCVIRHLCWLLAIIEGVSSARGAHLLQERAQSILEARYTPNLLAHDGHDQLIEQRCASAVAAVAPLNRRQSPPRSTTGFARAFELKEALLYMGEAPRDVLLDEFVEQAAMWSVGRLGWSTSDGTAARSCLRCFSAILTPRLSS